LYVLFPLLFWAALGFARASGVTSERARCAKLAASSRSSIDGARYWSGYDAACSHIEQRIMEAPTKGGAA